MKLRTITIKDDEAIVVVENNDYVILYEADLYEDAFGDLHIEGAYDIVGLDGNTRIQDTTWKEDGFIEDAIERKWDELYNTLTKRNLERQNNKANG